VTTGLLGVVAWVLFLGLFVYTGLRTLIKGQSTDIFWYFVGTISFVGGLFMWLLSIVYVPGPAVLIICSVMTGLMVVSNQILVPRAKNSYNLLSSSKTGFILIASVMVFIIGAIAVGYGSVRQLSAAYIYSTAENNLPTDRNQFDVVSERMLSAYNLYPSDTYMRGAAGYQYAHFNSLLSIQNSTPEQQQEFQAAVTNAIKLSSDAVAGKSTDSRNWQLAADIFASISLFKPEAMDMAFERYRNAEVLDPQNPYYVLQKAAMEFRVKNYDEASALTQMSLQLKPNFTDALFLSSQIDIAKGDINKAIITTQAMISLESNNPGRYYQLGVLQAAAKNTDASIDAFTAAVNLNPTYANARYFRAQQYLIKGDKNLAISEFEAVRDMSPDNSSVNELISKIKNGEVTGDTLNQEQPVTESSTVTVENEVATTSTVPESNLLTPVNTPTVKTEVNDSATVAE
jgi:tetratricopeptide (TPR) repeat protein